MLLQLDFSSDLPIYLQIRNQIVLGIGKRSACAGRASADDPYACG